MSVSNKERRSVYLQRKKEGLCPRCGAKKKKSEKSSYCGNCLEFYRNYHNENSTALNKTRKLVYKQRIKNNQCPRCGKKHRAGYTKKICKKCLEKQYQYNT